MKITIPVQPTAQQRARHTKTGRAYKSRNQKINEAHIAAYLARCDHRFGDEPLRLQLTAHMPVPKSWSRKKQAAALAGEIWPAKKPDLSNLIKQVEDVANKLLFDDDRQICQIMAAKCYSERPRWEVTIEPIWLKK